jgi:hypothetical protein
LKEAVKHNATNNHQHKPFFDKTGTGGMFGDFNNNSNEPFFPESHVKSAGFDGGGSGGSGGSGGGDVIQKKKGPSPPQGNKGQKPGGGKAGLTSAQRPLTHFNLQAKKFKDGSSVTILTSAVVSRVHEVVHDRKVASGVEKLPYEYLFRYQRRVSIKTADQESVTLEMDAESYLPFAEVDGKTSLSLKDALAMKADFSKVKWTVSGGFNKDKYGKALKGKYGIDGTRTAINGKAETFFFFDEFYKQDIVKADNARTTIAMPDLATKSGLAFLKFSLSEAQQYQSIVDYMNGLMGHHIDEEYKLRSKKQKKQAPQKDPDPAPKGEPEEVIENAGDVDPDATEVLHKHDDLPGWMKAIGNFFGSIGAFFSKLWNKLPPWARGILKALGVAALFIAGTVLIAAIIVAAVPTLTIGAVVGTIAALALAFSFGFSLGTRWRQSTSVKEFFWSIPVAIFDAIGITSIYESIFGTSIFTGDKIEQDEEDRWYGITSGILTFFGTIFGVRSWTKKPKLPNAGTDPVPAGKGGGSPIPPSGKGGGTRKRGFFERILDWFGKGTTRAISKSKKSLLDFLDRVWKSRDAIAKKQKDVYDLYAETTEPNPLTQKSPQQYTAQLEQLKQGKTNWDNVKDPDARANATDVVYVQQGSTDGGFTHFYRKSGGRTTQRIYLNVKADKAPEVMQTIVNDMIGRPDKFPGVNGGKVSGANSVSGRPDAIIIYLEDGKAAQLALEFIAGLKQKSPSSFMETTPPMTSEVTPGVSVANEPVQTPGGPRKSFGESRSDVITEALNNTMSKNGSKDDFIKEVLRLFQQQGIDAQNPHLNK